MERAESGRVSTETSQETEQTAAAPAETEGVVSPFVDFLLLFGLTMAAALLLVVIL